MALFTVTTATTASLALAALDDVIVSSTGSILSNSTAISGVAHNNELIINGEILSSSTGISLQNSAVGDVNLIIGTTGSVLVQDGKAISIAGDRNHVTNLGTVASAGSVAIELTGNNATAFNSGTVHGETAAFVLGDSGYIRNEGSISSSSSAPFVSTAIIGGLSTIISNAGDISSIGSAIDIQNGSIENTGTISSASIAIQSDGIAKVYNQGTISGGTALDLDFVTSGSALVNSGTIMVGSVVAGAPATYSVLNSGHIASTGGLAFDAFFITFENSGSINTSGFIAATSTVYLMNSATGSIHSSVGSPGGLVTANFLSLDNAGTISGYTGFSLSGTIFKNSGSLQTRTDTLTLSSTGYYSKIANSGEWISGEDAVVSQYAVSFRNTGSVIAEGFVLDTNEAPFGSQISNSGVLQSGDIAIRSGIFTVVNNSGTISGQWGGLDVGGESIIRNAGEISGSTFAIKSFGGLSGPIIVNSGLITSLGDAIVVAEAGHSGRIVNTGTISGINAITYELSSVAPPTAHVDIFNSGTIIGNVVMSSGNDTFDGRAGVTLGEVNGGDGNDLLIGGEQADVLTGGAGENTLRGLGGDDTLTTGDDKDTIFGGFGDDTIVSGNGDDTIRGGDGEDDINGQGGVDFIQGGNGNDTIRMGNGDGQRGEGNNGNDYIVGGNQKDILLGGADADELIGNFGDDVLRGGTGDDILEGGAGNDRLVGNAGEDTAVFSGNLAAYTFTLNANGTVDVAHNDGAGANGTDNLFGIEYVEFNDGTYLLSDFV